METNKQKRMSQRLEPRKEPKAMENNSQEVGLGSNEGPGTVFLDRFCNCYDPVLPFAPILNGSMYCSYLSLALSSAYSLYAICVCVCVGGQVSCLYCSSVGEVWYMSTSL